MKHGRSGFSLLFRAALSGVIALSLLGAASPALAQKPSPAHAKPKNKKPKPPAKGAHHGAAAPAKAGNKAHPAHVVKATGGLEAPKPAKDVKDPLVISLPVQRVTLENGLRVVMSVDHTSPAIAISIAYDVGSRDEPKGRSGSARLLERLMFRGSTNVLSGDHARLVMSHGGQAKSVTGADITLFSQSFPSSELALGLWLEADRMKSLTMNAEAFESERRAAQDEARAALGSSYASSSARMNELIFQGSWAYEHPSLGSPDDLTAASLEELKQIRGTHYGPNNAALVVAGDIDPDEVMTLVHKHFDGIPKITLAPFAADELPEQTAQRTAVVRGEDVRKLEVRYGWAIPESRSADRAAIELGAILLADGESSRLCQTLVRDKAVADEVTVTLSPMSRGPGSLRIVAKLSDGAKVGDVEKLIEGELKRLGTAPPTDAELQKARRRARSRFVLGELSTVRSRADHLAASEVILGSALHINDELPRIAAVSADDVRRVASLYLGPTRRTLVETYPMSVDPTPPPPPQPQHASAAPSHAAKKTTKKAPKKTSAKLRKPHKR